jgi:hypothetical protein
MGPAGVLATARAGPHTPARPNTTLEATGHSLGFLVSVGPYPVGRASAWALGCAL